MGELIAVDREEGKRVVGGGDADVKGQGETDSNRELGAGAGIHRLQLSLGKEE